MSERPDPESFLRLAEAEESRSSRGKLKIFLGYSAGVGKTYAMLEAARRLRKDGVDIVIAYVEPHKRAETEVLLEGLEAIPRKPLLYRGTTLYEPDLDAILKRQPGVAVVDELAHTNAPGSRHKKRYQDIEELLNAGINVYSTLNIQHLESLNDVIAKITGIAMHETVPDTVLDEADEIEVVDLPIDELLKRLKEGKVYIPEQAERAIQNFFNGSNLASLREITLRRAAKRLGFRRQTEMQGERGAGEKLIVCVTSYASSTELVRAAKLLAVGLDADWYAVYVEASGRRALTMKEQDRLTKTLQLAEELGAKPVALSGRNIAEEIVNYANTHQVTKILIGKPLKRRFRDIVFGSVVDQLIRLSGGIDVYVVTRSSGEQTEKELETGSRNDIAAYVLSAGFVLLATLVSGLLRTFLAPTNLVMIYLLAIIVSAIFFGRGPSVFVAVLSVLAFDFFFVPPFFSFAVSDSEYFLTFMVFMLVGLVIGTLTTRIKNQAESARARESYTASLYGLSRDLAGVLDKQAVLKSLSRHVKETLLAGTAVFLKKGGSLEPLSPQDGIKVNDREAAVADWVAKNGEPAGWSTDTIPGATGYYLPLQTVHGVFGVVGVFFKKKGDRLPLDRQRLLEAFAAQSALALERIGFSEDAQKTKMLEEREKLQSALFNSISHDLRTPLVSITGSLSGMLENPKMSDESRKELLENAYEEATRLNRLVGNLLDMARLEADAMKIAPVPCEIRDVIGSALKELDSRLEDRKVTVTIEEDLPHVPMDFSLMMKVLVNLIDNAVKYAPFGLPVDIDAKKNGERIDIRVMDRGLGIPESDLELVFNKFYRVNRPQNFEGTGLGLSICRGIVEAHHGKIKAENRQGGGTIVTVSLPVSP